MEDKRPEDQTTEDSKVPSTIANGDIITTNLLSTTVADETIPEVDESHETPTTKGMSLGHVAQISSAIRKYF